MFDIFTCACFPVFFLSWNSVPCDFLVSLVIVNMIDVSWEDDLGLHHFQRRQVALDLHVLTTTQSQLSQLTVLGFTQTMSCSLQSALAQYSDVYVWFAEWWWCSVFGVCGGDGCRMVVGSRWWWMPWSVTGWTLWSSCWRMVSAWMTSST